MGCSIKNIQITDNQSNSSEISQDLQEVEISILSIHNGIECLKLNIQLEKQNYPDDIIMNEISEQMPSNWSSQESSIQSDRPSMKSCLKQLSSSLSLSKQTPEKKVHFHVSKSKFSQQKKQKKRRRKTVNRPQKQINLDEIF